MAAVTDRQAQVAELMRTRERQWDELAPLLHEIPKALVKAQKKAAISPAQWRGQAVRISAVVTQLELAGFSVLGTEWTAPELADLAESLTGVKRMGDVFAWVGSPP